MNPQQAIARGVRRIRVETYSTKADRRLGDRNWFEPEGRWRVVDADGNVQKVLTSGGLGDVVWWKENFYKELDRQGKSG